MSRATGDVWSPDLSDAVYKAYIVEGLSAAQTARQLGQGLTRSSVIGGAHRKGWSKSAPGGATKVPVRVNPIPTEDVGGALRFVMRNPDTAAAKLGVDLDLSECRWPVGSASGMAQKFCAAAVEGKGPYCSAHRGRAYQKVKPCAS